MATALEKSLVELKRKIVAWQALSDEERARRLQQYAEVEERYHRTHERHVHDGVAMSWWTPEGSPTGLCGNCVPHPTERDRFFTQVSRPGQPGMVEYPPRREWSGAVHCPGHDDDCDCRGDQPVGPCGNVVYARGRKVGSDQYRRCDGPAGCGHQFLAPPRQGREW